MNKTKRLLISMLTLLCCCMGMWAEGELNGEFTISASGGKVKFSQGNLQYQASTNTWRFATNQYDYIGNAAGNTSPSSTQTAWIDYFNWGTSGYNHGANCYQPWSTSTTRSDYYAYGSSSKNLYDAKDDNSMRGQADWGYNAISNGGNTENSGWRILTKDEWAYLINTRSETYRYAKGTIHGTNGLMLFPDGFTLPTGVSISNANTTDASYTSYSDDTWTALEAAGVVFLPATGLRNGTSVLETGSVGNYWSSTCMNANSVYNIRFDGSSLNLVNDGDRQNGFPVRLVKSNLKQDGEGNYLIGSVQDWNDFATIVNNGINRTANAKMTANIDLGTDQTMMGNPTYPYGGVFDGQGHTLTVHLNIASDGIAPFHKIDGATIKNLAVAGSVTGGIHSAGLVGGMPEYSTFNLISNVMVSATITTTGSHCGGILGHGGSTENTTIQDCLFNGTINGKDGGSTVGVIWGWQTYGHANIISCLENGTYTNCSSFEPLFQTASGPVYSYSNNYYVNGSSTYGTQATTTTLGDGTVTTALNDGRTGDDAVWVQQGSQPMLKTFAVETDESGTYLIGSVDDWKAFADIVKTTPNANAKMTADVNLGSNQSHIGSMEEGGYAFSGTFDGQGHTLTVAYVGEGSQLVSPFSKIYGATIKNLHVAGSIQSTFAYVGVVGFVSGGTVNISNVWMSASFSTTFGQADLAAFVGGSSGSAYVTISDCLYTGSMLATGSYSGCFLGFYNSGTVIMKNCLATGSYTYTYPGLPGSYSNCYIKSYPISLVTGITQPTGENLSDGTTTTALNNGRKNGPWVQDAVSGEPRLDLFMATTSVTAHEGATGEYWSTYYDGAKSSIADANTTVYTGKVNGDKIDLTEIVDKTIPAGNAVILKSTAANVTLTKTSATGTLANNDLKGVDVATAKTGVYCLSKNGTVVGFYKFTGDVPAHRAYIEIVSSAPMLGFDDGGTTEIMTLNIEHGTLNNGSWYTLDGRQLNAQPSRKGIYVRNGKKFIVK